MQAKSASQALPLGRHADWPADGEIDLERHDRPHASSWTEWWYTNAHLATEGGRTLSLFAAFFRNRNPLDPSQHVHALTWSLIDADRRTYHPVSYVDAAAPEIALDRLERGSSTLDPLLKRAIRELLERGSVPLPDRLFPGSVHASDRRLDLDFAGCIFRRLHDGSYELCLHGDEEGIGCELRISPRTRAIRHGDNGVVRGTDGSDLFYYFIPRCDVSGWVTVEGSRDRVLSGQAWYDHEFGGKKPPSEPTGQSDDWLVRQRVAWDWTSIQFDDQTELTAYALVDTQENAVVGSFAVVVDPDGKPTTHSEMDFTSLSVWRSRRTFDEYPTKWRLRIPDAEIDVTLTSSFDDQEFVTVLSSPAFWEGRIDVAGTRGEAVLRGTGFVERTGFSNLNSLEDFLGAVGAETRRSIRNLVPTSPSYEQVRDLVCSEEREYLMEGVDADQLVRTMMKPVREVVDRGGKAWRSYAMLACCDIVGGDSRNYTKWLALPELLHVGSLIVDDVQDRSSVRRGGPACHILYGEPTAINAGTACYFMTHGILVREARLTPRQQLRIHDYYFQALRAGHAGQALDLDGFDGVMKEALVSGDSALLEERILAVHRLKTAAPAGCLARMGAVVGEGSEEQIEGIGRYFEALGLAFQITDDVLNLRGFERDLKQRGEDIANGTITLPMAKAIPRLTRSERDWLWETLRAKTRDPAVIDRVVELVESTGAMERCRDQAEALVESGWEKFHPLVPDSISKVFLRAFSWYLLARHY